MLHMDSFRRTERLLASVASSALLLGTAFVIGQARPAFAQDNDQSKLQSEVQKALDKKELQGVHAAVQGNTVVLTGTADSYAAKEEADRRVHRVHGVKGVENDIEVGGASVSDEALRDKLSKQLSTYMVGYGTNAFDAINLGVQNGVVTLSGTVYGPYDKDSALSLVSNTPGVKDVVDDLKVAPVSPMDDQLRLALARKIYGQPTLQKYALDPAKPIRITVVNGNVMLSGVVDSEMDKNIAGIQANSVPGVFKVVNNLQVAGAQGKESSRK